jgi:hypothetical protein
LCIPVHQGTGVEDSETRIGPYMSSIRSSVIVVGANFYQRTEFFKNALLSNKETATYRFIRCSLINPHHAELLKERLYIMSTTPAQPKGRAGVDGTSHRGFSFMSLPHGSAALSTLSPQFATQSGLSRVQPAIAIQTRAEIWLA